MWKLKLIYPAALVVCLCFYCSLGSAQSKSGSSSNNCGEVVTSARQALTRGNLGKVDTIYMEFMKSPCQSDKNSLKEMYKVMSNRMARVGFWVESESFDKKITELNGGKKNNSGDGFVDVPAHQFIAVDARYGIRFTREDQHTIGLKYGNYNENGWGYEIGSSYQQFNSVIKKVDNKDPNGRYIFDGFYFQGATKTTAIGLSLGGSYSESIADDLGRGIYGSIGFAGGIEGLFLTNTLVKAYYKEVEYVDTVLTINETLSQHRLSFNAVDRSNYDNKKFFQYRTVFRLYLGPQYRLQWKRAMLGANIFYTTPSLPQFKVREAKLEKTYAPGGYLTFSLHLAYVFKQEKTEY